MDRHYLFLGAAALLGGLCGIIEGRERRRLNRLLLELEESERSLNQNSSRISHSDVRAEEKRTHGSGLGKKILKAAVFYSVYKGWKAFFIDKPRQDRG